MPDSRSTIILVFLGIVIIAALRVPGRTSLLIEIRRWIRIYLRHADPDDQSPGTIAVQPAAAAQVALVSETEAHLARFSQVEHGVARLEAAAHLARVDKAVSRAIKRLRVVSRKSGRPKRAKRARRAMRHAVRSLAEIDLSGHPYEIVDRMVPMISQLIASAESCNVQVSPILYQIRNGYLRGRGQLPG